MRRTAEAAEQTRRALLEAALLTFEEKGWRGATFEVVAARAGVTRGALHHHFSSKVVLLEDALAWGWAEYEARLFDAEPADLAALLPEFVHLLREDARFRALAACTVLVAPQALGDATEKNTALDAWRDRIAAGLPATAEAAPGAVANLTLVLMQGLTVTAVMRPDDLPRPDELSATISALARGLRPT
ncbi:TetR/AcrR family transcriptional regulator [Propionibacterium australiense]|uniref:DNA-binding HTH domain, TetR-type n=1 Tax=Propionibacterium australiense TaxID=119981 RepID=A0A383S7Y5_9ACTN|nr:TetR family transcriptional regulator [Propionibacterium australiense]RLP09504.1 TetR family transcriptional regulator [Propionibacterium australiense]RLP09917.1 TetR family transcriptional regulator [Propionibacterium australiense]SYZ33831.1 DNA-binding HTH domain, TetR-type [Propionibacterium australiense]VEH91979.1 Solvent efflux pump srpABC operon corepressor [Propionibacterium australiense]